MLFLNLFIGTGRRRYASYRGCNVDNVDASEGGCKLPNFFSYIVALERSGSLRLYGTAASWPHFGHMVKKK